MLTPAEVPETSGIACGLRVQRSSWLFGIALVLVVCLVYQPAWSGGLIIDDSHHVSPVAPHSWQGLYRIWSDVKATAQYYPLLHSAFWLEHKLWGDATPGYHLVNIALHALAALLVAALLGRLGVPGEYLAAAISRSIRWRWSRWPGSRSRRTRSRPCFTWRRDRSTSGLTRRGALVVCRGDGVVRDGFVEQDGHGDAAGGAAGDLLVEARRVGLAARRSAAAALARPRRGGGGVHRVGRAQTDRRGGSGI